MISVSFGGELSSSWLSWFMRMGRSVSDVIRYVAPALVSASGVATPVVMPTPVALISWALFMSLVPSPTIMVSCGLVPSFFSATVMCSGAGFTVCTQSRVAMVLKNLSSWRWLSM